MIIRFNDPLIEEVVRNELANESGDITNEDLDKVETLELSELGLLSLPDLIKFTNLKILNIYSNSIKDIEVIEDLVRLEELYLNNNDITDLEPLANMLNLVKLELSYNDISDLKYLEDLKNLTVLNLSFNNIVDISSLKNLSSLKELHLEGNKVKNIEVLKKLDLNYLSINKEQVLDITFLEHIKDLVII